MQAFENLGEEDMSNEEAKLYAKTNLRIQKMVLNTMLIKNRENIMPRGNLIRRVIAEYDNASIQEIELKTRINLQAIANACSEETRFETVFIILHSCIHLAVGRKGKVNKKEEKFPNTTSEKQKYYLAY